jgi:putative transposase
MDDQRELRGWAIAESPNQIKRLADYAYSVRSQSGNGNHDIRLGGQGWICSCPDHTHRGVKCKHIWAVEFSRKLRREVQSRVIEPISDIHSCIFCGSSKIVRDGIRHNKFGDIQKFNCKDCRKYFTINIGFEKMKHSPQGITTAMQLYFSGESLRNTAKSLRLIGVQVSHRTVLNWIQKYTSLMQKYLDKIQPQVSDTWRADELFLKVRGNMKYLFALMDDETRFWIAQEVAETKFTHDARALFRMGKELTGKKPMLLITDGLPSYHDAYRKEFWQHEQPRPQHISHIRIQGDRNNNKMERLNGEVRDREKVMRGLKKSNTPILTGYQIYHNYMRPHEALDGRTPADACGIKVEGENKWVTLIQNASSRGRHPNVSRLGR